MGASNLSGKYMMKRVAIEKRATTASAVGEQATQQRMVAARRYNSVAWLESKAHVRNWDGATPNTVTQSACEQAIQAIYLRMLTIR
jgi:hypothetical protein